MEEMRSIDARDADIGEYIRDMAYRTKRDNSVTGKISNAEHGDVRIIMFIENEVLKPYGGD